MFLFSISCDVYVNIEPLLLVMLSKVPIRIRLSIVKSIVFLDHHLNFSTRPYARDLLSGSTDTYTHGYLAVFQAGT